MPIGVEGNVALVYGSIESVDIDFPILKTGYHEFDININHVSSGIYFYQFTINEIDYIPHKMVLLK